MSSVSYQDLLRKNRSPGNLRTKTTIRIALRFNYKINEIQTNLIEELNMHQYSLLTIQTSFI